MEGKELHDEDDDLKSGSKKNQETDSDDFGLPDASSDSGPEEKKENIEETSFEYTPDPDPEDEPTGFGEFEDDTPTYRYTPVEEKSTAPTGLIVFLSILGVLIIVVVIYWFFIRTPGQERQPRQEVSQQVTEEPAPQEPVIEEPVDEEPPPVVTNEPVNPASGGFETINSSTGRYYIVLNSFFDEDLASDYAKELADRGVSTLILSPSNRKGFNRVAINEDFGSWNAAENRMTELKGIYGDDIWVLKY